MSYLGFKVCPSQLKPLGSAFVITHTVKISLGPRVDSNPLKLTFPHPVRDEDIWIVSEARNMFKVALKKAVQDPWPCEIQGDKAKWDSGNMKIWEDVPHGSNSLRSHLDSQFELYHLEYYPSLERKVPLYNIKDHIRELFYNPNLIFFKIEHSPIDVLRIFVHQPVLTSPNGSPMLFLSIHDPKLQKFLASEGKLDASHHDSIYNRIYADVQNSNKAYLNILATPEEMLWWRYIFRVNSTKFQPITWQKDNIPLGANSAWLATFISPHYLDCPFKKMSYEEFKAKNPNFKNEPRDFNKGYCTACGTISENLKSCRHCRFASYCSVECQKTHWDQHKAKCGKL